MKKLILVALVIITAACSTKKAADGLDGFAPLKQESYGGRETESHEVITSQEQLKTLYSELNIESVPDVDFSKKNVVALFMGMKSSGGYSISIDKMERSGDTLIITAKKSAPEGNATMAITQPYFIAAVPKTAKVEVK